jgi:ubiquitin carboxyl-terminal hydrolase 7
MDDASIEESLSVSPNPEQDPNTPDKLETVEQPAELANDVEAMKCRIFPPLDDLEALAEGYNTWHIDDWKGLPERSNGPSFDVGNHFFRLLLFPEGNRSECLSIYLEASPVEVPDESEDEEWAVCAQFGLVMWNPDDPSIHHLSVAQHRFNPDESDWGFTRFYDLRKLSARHLNTERALIENNKVNITAYVRVIKDPTGVLWHNFIKYNSKKETGYVGLKNQGATCYLNSLLQSLYFTKVFRRAVYKIPTEDDKPNSVPAALQRLFYLLHTADQPVGTLQLTRSFGWDSADAFTQHDVQELNRVLMDKLEGKMKGTGVEGALNNIFVAQMKSYVRCVNVDFESSRTEDYWDIQLNVKGMRDIEDSFRDYIQVEMLDGENQYQATGYGLQDAKKGVVFQSFPPVLHLQLKRYEYDFNRDMMVKINDRYEFPTEIDLSSYLEEGSDMSEPWIYGLHGVLVHSGDLNAGHYYALLKPTQEDKWYKFDDDRVTRATMKEVLEENFGGEATSIPAQGMQQPRVNRLNFKRHSSAYMLVYLRKSRLNDILPASNDDIPDHIPRRLELEAADEAARRKEREEQHFYMNVRVMSNQQFHYFQGFDVGLWDTRYAADDDLSRPLSYKILKTATVADFIKSVADAHEIRNPAGLRLWTMTSRQNKTFRLDSPISTSDYELSMEELKDKTLGRYQDLRLWLDEVPEGASQQEHKGHQLLVFLKYFNVAEQTLTGVGTWLVGEQDKVGELATHINEVMGWPQGTTLRLVEEVKPDMIEEIKPKATFTSSEISDGDIICFERVLPAAELEKLDDYRNATDFYDFMHYRIRISFRRRATQAEIDAGKEHGTDGAFEIWLSRKDMYDRMAYKVGRKLGVDPTHLQFFTTTMNGFQRSPIRRNGSNIQQILAPPYGNQYTSTIVLYEILDMSLSELEKKKSINVSWLTEGLSQEHKYDVLVPKTATMQDVLSVLQEKANIPVERLRQVKVWGAQNSRMHRIYNETFPVASIVDSVQIYAAICPDEEFEFINSEVTPADRKLIFVVHFQKDPSRTHSVPFTFLLKQDEPFKETKLRLQKVLGIYDKVFEKVKFAVLRAGTYGPPEYVDDEEELFATMVGSDDVLGLDHVDKTTRRGYGQQAAIFIKN